MNERDLHDLLRESIRANTMDTARSEQTKERLVGMSDLGSCRNYLRLLLTGAEMSEPPDAEDTIGVASFVGTAVGDRVETVVAGLGVGFQAQVPITCVLPQGFGKAQGTADLVSPKWVVDVKTKAGLALVRREGPPFANLVQASGYLVGAIQAGIVEPEARAALWYIDRSGRTDDTELVVITLEEAEDYLRQAVERLDDVAYAIHHGEEASRDEPDQWCRVACTMYEHCRGGETDVGGLLHEKHVRLVDHYLAGRATKQAGEALMEEVREKLRGVNGSTGTHLVREIHVNGRGGQSVRLDIRPLPKGKL